MAACVLSPTIWLEFALVMQENADEMFEHLKAKFPMANFQSLEGERIAKMSIREQVQ